MLLRYSGRKLLWEKFFMQVRKLPHGDEQISVIGLGLGIAQPGDDVMTLVEQALARGINFFDLCCGYECTYAKLKAPFAAVPRSSFYTQLHLGATYKDGVYAFSRKLDKVKDTFLRELDVTGIGYTDFGMLHCIDELKDLDDVLNRGIYELAQELKAQGIIRHLGFSTHNPAIARKLLELGGFDLFMFSINAAFDFKQDGELALGATSEREELYRMAEAQQVAISVMKPFAGGQLLTAASSPIGVSLSIVQCLQYVLDRPAVVTAIAGATKASELDDYFKLFTATPDELDYGAAMAHATQAPELKRCVYCNHCAPCPKKLNVGLINKYYDLAQMGDHLAREHYLNLEHHASECNDCGHCVKRCPFHCDQIARMHEIAVYFGR